MATEQAQQDLFTSLDQWRSLLAVAVFKNNKTINEEQLNSVVQSIIDCLLFLRIAESKNIVPAGKLQATIKHGNFYKNLIAYFLECGKGFNAGLFAIADSRATKKLIIGNKTIATIINELCDAASPAMLATLPVQVIGNAYEQFLGKQIKIDAAHKVTIVEKPEIKKAGGVFYTPAYIVDYILKQTVGEAIRGKTPDEISKLKIVDPSCGCGNFLIGAYQWLLDWHKYHYSNDKKISKQKKETVLTKQGYLTIAEKKRILLNNIYGVDLDSNAVEVTKLILLLKCMESETPCNTAATNITIPALHNTIKTGNSLSGNAFAGPKQTLLPNIESFNWSSEFPPVVASGGFDIVIGNPPYGAELTKDAQPYLLEKYKVGITDTAALFMIQARRLLKTGGFTGFIIPKSFTYASNWQQTRKELLGDISLLVDCSKVWRTVKLEMTIFISRKNSATKEFTSCIRKGEEIIEIGKIKKSLCDRFNFILNGVNDKDIRTGVKLFNSPKRFNDYFANKRGAMLQQHVTAKGRYYVIGGKQVQRYFIINNPLKRVKKAAVVNKNSFINKEAILVQNIVAHIQHPVPRIQITATMVDTASANGCVIRDTVNQLTNQSSLSSKYLLGVLNSKPISWYTYRFVFANAIRTMHFDSITTAKIPFPNIDLNNTTHKALYEQIIKAVEQLLVIKKGNPVSANELQNRKINSLQQIIDSAICELFGLNATESLLLS